jgi:hypothetical protein
MRILLAATSLLIAPASAQDAPLAGEGYAGDMHVVQVTISDLTRFGEQYQTRRTNGLPQSATHAALGDSIFTVAFFDRCRAGSDGVCNLTAELRLVDPQGGVGEPRTGTLWQFQPPRAGEPTMPQSMIAIRLGEGRPPGDYRIRVTTRDNVAGTSVTTERVLTIGDSR